MDSDFWTSRLAAAKRHYTIQHHSQNSYLGLYIFNLILPFCFSFLDKSDFFLKQNFWCCQIGWESMILMWRMRSDPIFRARIVTKTSTSPPCVRISKTSTRTKRKSRYVLFLFLRCMLGSDIHHCVASSKLVIK